MPACSCTKREVSTQFGLVGAALLSHLKNHYTQTWVWVPVPIVSHHSALIRWLIGTSLHGVFPAVSSSIHRGILQTAEAFCAPTRGISSSISCTLLGYFLQAAWHFHEQFMHPGVFPGAFHASSKGISKVFPAASQGYFLQTAGYFHEY